VNRALYVDETTLAKRPDFAVLQTAISAFLQDFSEHVEEYAADRALAAE
jgi:N-formylglutamate amidohydrolase